MKILKLVISIILINSIVVGCNDKMQPYSYDGDECDYYDGPCLPSNFLDFEFSIGQDVYPVIENENEVYYRLSFYECIEGFIYKKYDYSTPIYFEDKILSCENNTYLNDSQILEASINGLLR